MAKSANSVTRASFGSFEADFAAGTLYKHGVRIKLQHQPFQVLAALIQKPNELVTREELRHLIWAADTFVDFEHGLNAAINKLRQALMDSASNPRYIETNSGRGYRFIAPVRYTQAASESPPESIPAVHRPKQLLTGLNLVAGALLGLAVAWLFNQRSPVWPDRNVLQFTIDTPRDLSSEPAFTHQDFAISPDGKRLAFLANDLHESQLWIREMSSGRVQRLSEGRNVNNLAWSSDSRSLYFSELANIRRVPATGGPSVSICDIPQRTIWNALVKSGPNLLLFTRTGSAFMVGESGGPLLPALRSDVAYIWPHLLPNGNLLHLSFNKNIRRYEAWVSELKHPERKTRILETDSRVQFSPPAQPTSRGHLVFIKEGTLVAQPFDTKTLKTHGEPQPIAENVFWFEPSGTAQFSISQTGLLVYRRWENRAQLTWVDRKGHALGLIGKPQAFLSNIRLSPDQTKLAVAIYSAHKGGSEIWVYDLPHQMEKPLTRGVGHASSPAWASDGKRLAFLRASGASPKLFLTGTEEGAKEHSLANEADMFQLPTDWSRDGRFLLYQTMGSAAHPEIGIVVLDLARQNKRFSLIEPSENSMSGAFSPDNSLLAFLSNDDGKVEAYVQPFHSEPEPRMSGERRRVSNDGASFIRWRSDGKELFYLNGENWVVSVGVNYTRNHQLSVTQPRKLFRLNSKPQIITAGSSTNPAFDVSADGQRFVVAEPLSRQESPFVVVENWQALVDRKR
jgi:eukaryotic-like serine/threonine-protein kinase